MADTIATNRTEQQSWLVAVLLMCCPLLYSTTTGMLAPLLVDLARDFQSTVPAVGQLAAATSLAWALAAPALSPLSDRYGRKPLMLVGLGVLGLMTAGASLAPDLALLFGLRFLAGLGGGALGPSVNAAVVDYFPPSQRAQAFGLVMAGFSFGALLGVPLVAVLAALLGWRLTFLAIGALLLALAIVVAALLPPPCLPPSPSDQRKSHRDIGGRGNGPHPLPPLPILGEGVGFPSPSIGGRGWGTRAVPASLPSTDGYLAGFGVVLRTPNAGPLLLANLGERTSAIALATYLPSYLIQRYDLPLGYVALLLALIAIGSLAGTLGGGHLANLAHRPTIYGICQAAACVLVLPLLTLAPPLVFVVALGIGHGLLNNLSRPSYMSMVGQLSADRRGTVMGLNAVTNQSGMVLGAAVGGLALAGGGYDLLAGLIAATGGASAVIGGLRVRERDVA